MAVYIEGHAESLIHEAGRGEKAIDGVRHATERLEREQRTGSKGFANYSTSTSKASKSLDHFEGRTHRVRSGLIAVGKGAGIAAAAIATGLIVETKRATEAYEESYKVGRQTNAVIASTGGVARVTASHVGDLANSISLKSGIDDEAIQSGENLLLTFKNIRNEAGQGNKIFDQATQITTDMSVAMGKDLTPTVIGVGKALNDPIKGVSALTKVGVTFNDQQKEQIETLVNSGKTMTAQKLILRELKSEFAGSAQAQATPIAKMKVAVENLEESLGSVLFPTIGKVAGSLAKFINQIQTGTGAGGRFKAWVQEAAHNVGEFGSTVVSKVRSVVASLKTFWKESSVTRAVVIGAFKLMKAGVQDTIEAIIGFLRGWAQIIRGVVKVISGVLTGDFGRAWDGVKDIFSGAIKALFSLLRGITAPIRAIIGKIGEGMAAGFRAAWRGITGVFESGVNKAIGFLNTLIDAINLIPGVPDIGHIGELGGRENSGTSPKSTKKDHGSKPATGRRRGGKIDRPTVLVGEEGPQWKEMVIAENPAYRRKNIGHWMEAGRMLGIPGFLSGGDITGALGAAANAATGGLAGKVYNTAKGAISGLPTPHIPEPLAGVGPYVVKQVAAWIKNGFSSGKLGSVTGTGIGPLGSGPVDQNLREAIAIGARHGSGISSFKRPDDPDSYHNPNYDPPHQAVDLSGGNMLATAKAILRAFGASKILELFHNPLGFQVDNYRKGPMTVFDHYDHVHVAFKEGGKIDWSKLVGSTWDNDELATLAHIVGMPNPGLMARQAQGESSGNQRAINHNADGSTDYGLWQINSVHGYDSERLLSDPIYNAKAAKEILESSGMGAWFAPLSGPTGHVDSALAAKIRAAVSGKGVAGSKSKFTPKFGLTGHIPLTVGGLKSKPLGEAAKALPKAIQGLLSQPGLSFSQRLGIGQFAGEQATSTFQPLLDENGNPVLDEEGNPIDSRADDIAAAKYVLGLQKANKKRIQKKLNRVEKRLHHRQSAAKRRRDLKRRSQLLESLGTVSSDIASARETIHGESERGGEEPTATDFANRDLALAELTPDLADDQAARKKLLEIAEAQLAAALQTADPRDDIEAAQNVKQLREAVEANTAIQEQREAFEKERLELDKRLVALGETQGPAFMAAFVAWIDGAIGGPAGVRAGLPGTAGVPASYR